MIENIIRIENVKFKYEKDSTDFAVDGVNLNIRKGEFTAVIGHNGSGKSTLAKLINSILLPTEGKIYVKEMDTSDDSRLWDIRQTAGMVFQNPDNQLVATIVEEDIAFGPENQGVEPSEIRKRVDEALNAVGMYEFRKRPPHMLSGGQKQRISIARGMLKNAPILILDDATSALDAITEAKVREKLRTEDNPDQTVIIITQRCGTAMSADHILVMESGRKAGFGTHEELIRDCRVYQDIYRTQIENVRGA